MSTYKESILPALLTIILILHACFIGCSQQYEYEAVKVTRWYDSAHTQMRAEYYVLKNDPKKLHGIYKVFSRDGLLESIETDFNGKLDGYFATYYLFSGKLLKEGTARDDQYEGFQREYYENGKLKREEEFRRGRLWRIITSLDTTGNKLSYGDFREGNGYVREYGHDGQLDADGKYIDGLKEGEWKYYFSNGNVSDRFNYIHGVQHPIDTKSSSNP